MRHPFGNARLREQDLLRRVVERVLFEPPHQRHRRVVEELERRELRVLVIRIVPAGLVELDLADMRGVNGLIAALEQLVLEEVFEDAPDDRPLGHPEDQARADQGRDREQAQLLADLAVVALLGLFDLGEVGVEVLLVEEGGAVDALEHRLVGVAFPVGPGDREELERADLAGVGDVRASAEVDELALAVEAQDAVLVQLVVDVLDLEAPGRGPRRTGGPRRRAG